MSKAYQFPRDDRPNPFAETAADGGPSAGANNPYAGPQGPAAIVAGEGAYDAVIPHRGALLLIMGIFGIVSSLSLAWLGLFCVPVGVIGLAITIPVWYLARHDLQAMHVGAMDRSGRGLTLAGFVLGIVGSLLSISSVLLTAAVVIRLFFS